MYSQNLVRNHIINIVMSVSSSEVMSCDVAVFLLNLLRNFSANSSLNLVSHNVISSHDLTVSRECCVLSLEGPKSTKFKHSSMTVCCSVQRLCGLRSSWAGHRKLLRFFSCPVLTSNNTNSPLLFAEQRISNLATSGAPQATREQLRTRRALRLPQYPAAIPTTEAKLASRKLGEK